MVKCAICKEKISLWNSKMEGDNYYCDACWNNKLPEKKRKEEVMENLKKEKEREEERKKRKAIKKPKFFKWAFLNWKTLILILFVLYYANYSASYSFIGFSGKLIEGFIFQAFLITFMVGLGTIILVRYLTYKFKFRGC